MMGRNKHIVMPKHPHLNSAAKLSPMDLNKIRFSAKRTVLTPEMLEKLASHSGDASDVKQRE